MMNRQTERWTDRQKKRQREEKTDRQKGRKKDIKNKWAISFNRGKINAIATE